MSSSAAYGGYGGYAALTRDQMRTLFSQTMGYPLPAASIFLDILNVFLFFLQIFTRNS